MTRLANRQTQGVVFQHDLASWPRLMRAETAARYVDERSVRNFRRSVGKVYPHPIKISGKGERWLRDHLDQTINSLFGLAGTIRDIADAL
jgi:hypothetical protein